MAATTQTNRIERSGRTKESELAACASELNAVFMILDVSEHLLAHQIFDTMNHTISVVPKNTDQKNEHRHLLTCACPCSALQLRAILNCGSDLLLSDLERLTKAMWSPRLF